MRTKPSTIFLGAVAADPEPTDSFSQEQLPAEAYLKSITVTGFSGHRAERPHRLQTGPRPHPSFCGRNGSGKSSFAEALEVLITGQVRRLKGRTGVWRTGWRSLAQPGFSPRSGPS